MSAVEHAGQRLSRQPQGLVLLALRTTGFWVLSVGIGRLCSRMAGSGGVPCKKHGLLASLEQMDHVLYGPRCSLLPLLSCRWKQPQVSVVPGTPACPQDTEAACSSLAIV